MVAPAHVEHLDRRQRTTVDPVGKAQAPEGHDALRPRGRAPGQQHGAVLLGAALGHRTGVIARIALVLVGGVVFLVDDDQPHIGQRREHGRAGPYAHAGLAAAQAQPFLLTLTLAEPRMEHRDDVAEAVLEAAHGLGSERDLRHEHNRAAPGGEHGLYGLEVHLGLARAGDSVQQEALRGSLSGTPSAESTEHGIERSSLLAGQARDPVEPAPPAHRRRGGRPAQRAQHDQITRLEATKGRRAERGGQRGPSLLEPLERRPAGARSAAAPRAGRAPPVR